MSKKPVAQGFFGDAGGPQQAAAPEKAKKTDAQTQNENGQGILHQTSGIRLHECQIVHRPFDDAGDEQLKQVHDDQA